MLILLSPAKTIDFSKNFIWNVTSIPYFIKEAEELVKELKKCKPIDLSSLMGISAKLADLNYERYLKWNKWHTRENAKQAVFAFNGDVYEGLNVKDLSEESLMFIDKNVRILSGLYGVLKPFDLMMEYRLELGTKLVTKKGTDLYQFWGDKLTKNILKAVEESSGEKILINLASNEYFKVIKPRKIKYPIITPVFKEYKDGELQFISFFAKKARGLMTRFIASENITNSEDVKMFNLERYRFDQGLSTTDQWVFIR
jgi:uncharacterized protein